jgi:Tfp pilus assembly protein PilF
LDGIEVAAYASPDGKQSINERLAKARQASSSDYINKKLEELDLVSPLSTRYTAEDWEGFQELVAASNIQDKEIILRVLSMYEDPEERERQIKNISAAYTELIDEILPELRRARITLNYVLIGRTDDEILKQLDVDASKLSVEELLYVATFDECVGKQKDIYTKTVQLYPNDYRAYNNLGLVEQLNGNMTAAKQWFEKAATINSNAPEVNANLALVAFTEGKIENAEAYLGRASQADTYNELLAALQVSKGNYAAAATNAKNGKSTTAALALLLNKDYASALTILNTMSSQTATSDYLKAICYARQNRTDAAVTALAAAFQKDASLKDRAAKDLEFAKLANKTAFKNLF